MLVVGVFILELQLWLRLCAGLFGRDHRALQGVLHNFFRLGGLDCGPERRHDGCGHVRRGGEPDFIFKFDQVCHIFAVVDRIQNQRLGTTPCGQFRLDPRGKWRSDNGVFARLDGIGNARLYAVPVHRWGVLCKAVCRDQFRLWHGAVSLQKP